MMEVKAVIRPNKLAALRVALLEMPEFPGMTVTKVEGCFDLAQNHFFKSHLFLRFLSVCVHYIPNLN